ncbi:MAG: hypothetical protein K0Q65_444 [Clostridia bacterium]|jgi:hypothetical protein|nr:hypothetical protein [Clostridia bacterium]
MEIEITVWKASGKYYTSGTARCDEDIPLWDDKFKVFVANNLPARHGEGYVTVADKDDDQSFHYALKIQNKGGLIKL